jgi:serine/threonine protein kinase
MDADDAAMEFLVSSSGGAPAPRVADPCPDENSVAAWAEGSAGAGEAAGAGDALEAHLAGCGTCRALVAALRDPVGGADPAAADDDVHGGPSRGGSPVPVRPAGPDDATRPHGAAPAGAVPGPLPGDPGSDNRGATMTSPPVGPGGLRAVVDERTTETFPRPFGPYTIVRRLGSGGMGVVYEAVHHQRRRPEALKVLKGGLGTVPEFVERFRREVAAMAGLAHDHVVPLYDSGQVGHDLYYTMPLLPGASLAEVLRAIREGGEAVPADRALSVLDRHGIPAARGAAAATPGETYARRVAASMVGVADALAAMHARGLLHRDLKPGNLMIDGAGRVLVSDFGLVRTGEPRITQSGQALGTPAYMSPEQVFSDGKEPDGRLDVYALGATLYELLTLRLPHEGSSGIETIRRKLSQRVVPVRARNPAVPEGLETLVGLCLERRRENRYPGAAALRDDLARFAGGEPVLARPVSPVTRALQALRRNAIPLSAAAAAVLGVLGWHFSRPTVLSVASIPSARLRLDGVEVGDTPVAGHRISPGAHELRLEHPRFAPFLRRFEVTRGSTFQLEPGLRAKDPADPEALRLVAAAMGLQVTGVEVEATRGAGDAPPLCVLFPRGRVREAPSTVRLHAPDVAEGWRLRLEAGGTTLAEVAVPAMIHRGDIVVPPDARSAMGTPGSYRARLVDAQGRDGDVAEFTVVDAAESRALREDLARLGRSFEAGDPVPEFLRIEHLMRKGHWEDAYERAVSLTDSPLVGRRREVARAALAVLEAAGLKDRGWWSQWAAMHAEGR